MGTVHTLFWFDTEECALPQTDDAAKRLALIMEEHGARGVFKMVGQKTRLLEQRVRFDVIDALARHDIGFHSNWHGLRPQIMEYLAPLTWEEGAEEFERREGPGLRDIKRVFGPEVVCYGQPGGNWAPQPFDVLRKWEIPNYISGYGFIGLDCQPFYLGDILCVSHMNGRRLNGEEQRHYMGLNFELGAPGELEKHKGAFERSFEQLKDTGGFFHILNHPCTLILEAWFNLYTKSRERIEAGYEHFAEFVRWVAEHDGVEIVSGRDLSGLYPDRAKGRVFGKGDLRLIAEALSSEISYVRDGDWALSAAEAFGLLIDALTRAGDSGRAPEQIRARTVHNPTRFPDAKVERETSVSWTAFCEAAREAGAEVSETGRLPHSISIGQSRIAPGDFLAAAARSLAAWLETDEAPKAVEIRPAPLLFEQYLYEEDARRPWKGAMAPRNFSAPNLIELARLLTWTIKPAIPAK